MNRGAFIAVGIGAAAAIAVAERRNIYLLAKGCGLPPPTPEAARNITFSQSTFYSHVLGKNVGTVRIDAIVGHPLEHEPAVIFALPGRGGTAYAQVAGLYLHDYFGEAVLHDATRPMTLIAVDGGESFWHARRGGEDRMKMFMEEVVHPYLRKTPTPAKRVGIIGWSMGGYGAFLAAERFPEIFGTICGVSVALWQTAAEQQHAISDAFDDANDFEHNNLLVRMNALRGKPIRISCGERDPFYANNRYLAQQLALHGVAAQSSFQAGCHDEGFWMRSAPDDFAFLVRSIAA